MNEPNYNSQGSSFNEKMPDLDFNYDNQFKPTDTDIPDPQTEPIILGSRVKIQKVGIGKVSLPVRFYRRDGTISNLEAKASLYGSLDNPNAKGLNLSRFYRLMHDAVADKLSIDGIKSILSVMRSKQNCHSAYCKLVFSYPWHQFALRSRKDSGEREFGHIFYQCELEGQMHGDEFKFYLTVDYLYSSTCPCSFELAHHARLMRGKAANGHSQRSIAKIKVQFDPAKPIWIEDIVELARMQVPTEVVIFCKRVDEQAFAELNGSNLMFTEDASRLLYQGLDRWFDEKKILDFSVVTDHIESLHPWNATAIIYKGIPGGLR